MKLIEFSRLKTFSLPAFLICCLLLTSQSCYESSAHHEVQKFSWEYPPVLTATDNLLAHSIDTFFQHRAKKAGLNGSVLVAQNGRVIYQHTFGFLNYFSKELLTDSSTFQLASVTKPFTATAVLLLHKRKSLNIDDEVAKYIKDFPYKNITIRQLLNHRSGLANYIYLFDTLKLAAGSFITNQDVVNYFVQHKPALQATPGHKFQYCNTNYALLAYIVELVSGQPFKDFLSENIFIPSHMYHTYVRNVSDTIKHVNQTIAYTGAHWSRVSDVLYDGVSGDKGIYTTAMDLYLFDQALNHQLLLDKELLAESYKGYSYEKPG
ncbi:MAG: serine hydrolase domain-containing protein, partial [Chitinophagales bacterium]